MRFYGCNYPSCYKANHFTGFDSFHVFRQLSYICRIAKIEVTSSPRPTLNPPHPPPTPSPPTYPLTPHHPHSLYLSINKCDSRKFIKKHEKDDICCLANRTTLCTGEKETGKHFFFLFATKFSKNPKCFSKYCLSHR